MEKKFKILKILGILLIILSILSVGFTIYSVSLLSRIETFYRIMGCVLLTDPTIFLNDTLLFILHLAYTPPSVVRCCSPIPLFQPFGKSHIYGPTIRCPPASILLTEY